MTAAPGPFQNPALLYADTEQYLGGVVPFVRGALAAGEPVAVAVPGEKLRLIRDALGADAGAVRCLDMREAGRNPGRIIPGVLHAFADGRPPGRRVRIVGESVWADRSAAEYPACAQHKALVNTAFRGREVTVLSPYDSARLSERALADAHANHPFVIPPGATEPRPSEAYDPEGVVARYNRPLPLPPVPGPAVLALAYGGGALSRARRLVTEHGRRLGLTGLRLQDLSLITAELTTNSVVHGGGTGMLTVWAEDGHVLLEVTDRGRLTDPLAGRRPAVRGRSGGRGLLLVNLLSDLVRTYTAEAGTTIRAYLAR
ncbi:anti-sigma factor RsbA family regulatory protein [Streptomyces sp. DSM 118148]|uniref:anti-sigma factor RsbA family regulatory protein n=1 Tax=Streptomyces sp. DSM 118148 TaxID=3448667 RepID=UPI0040402354